MEKLLILVIMLGLAALVFKLRGDAAKERKAVMARLATEREERGDYSPTAELFREVGVHHHPDAPLPHAFPTPEISQPTAEPPAAPDFAARNAGFARTEPMPPEPGDLRTLFKGIAMPAGLRPLGPLVPATASFVTDASPAVVHAGLDAEFERLECVATWVEPTVAQTERNGVRGVVTIYPNPTALTDLDGTPLFPEVTPGHVVVKMLAL